MALCEHHVNVYLFWLQFVEEISRPKRNINLFRRPRATIFHSAEDIFITEFRVLQLLFVILQIALRNLYFPTFLFRFLKKFGKFDSTNFARISRFSFTRLGGMLLSELNCKQWRICFKNNVIPRYEMRISILIKKNKHSSVEFSYISR